MTGLAKPVIKGPDIVHWNDHSGILKDSWLLGALPLRGLRAARAQRWQLLFAASLPAFRREEGENAPGGIKNKAAACL